MTYKFVTREEFGAAFIGCDPISTKTAQRLLAERDALRNILSSLIRKLSWPGALLHVSNLPSSYEEAEQWCDDAIAQLLEGKK